MSRERLWGRTRPRARWLPRGRARRARRRRRRGARRRRQTLRFLCFSLSRLLAFASPAPNPTDRGTSRSPLLCAVASHALVHARTPGARTPPTRAGTPRGPRRTPPRPFAPRRRARRPFSSSARTTRSPFHGRDVVVMARRRQTSRCQKIAITRRVGGQVRRHVIVHRATLLVGSNPAFSYREMPMSEASSHAAPSAPTSSSAARPNLARRRVRRNRRRLDDAVAAPERRMRLIRPEAGFMTPILVARHARRDADQRAGVVARPRLANTSSSRR